MSKEALVPIQELIAPAQIRILEQNGYSVVSSEELRVLRGKAAKIEEKRRLVEEYLTDPDRASLSDRAISRACAVSHTAVANYRRDLAAESEDS